MVPDEDERYGRDEMRRAAEGVRLRKPQTAQDHHGHKSGECAVFLAVAAARPRVPAARE